LDKYDINNLLECPVEKKMKFFAKTKEKMKLYTYPKPLLLLYFIYYNTREQEPVYKTEEAQ